MVPYIVILVFLIVLVLWQVYSQTEGFQGTVTRGDMLRDIKPRLPDLITRMKALQAKLMKLEKPFTPIITNEAEFKEIIGSIPLGGGKFLTIPTTSGDLALILFTKLNTLEFYLINVNDTTPVPTGQEDMFRKYITNVEKSVGLLEGVYAKSTGTAPVSTPSTTTTTTPMSQIVNTKDLYSALAPVSITEETGPMSETYVKELEDRIAKNVVKQIKDDLIANHQMGTPLPSMGQFNASDSMSQGAELQQMKPVLSPQPDMSQYIRKDSIPCYGCNLAS